ncbi:MAG: hypothetical protein WAW39_09380 [Prosthecobacter sp.]|uniref:hypothetical protein n=1 Tax=Prosthecobacter sp. TaxID=1965333 RepID=UPI003BAF14C1
MHLRLTIATIGVFHALALSAQDSKALPDKVVALKFNYEAAIQRATTPITRTYLQELQKLKMEYTKAGNLEAALATDAIFKEFADKTSQTSKPAAAPKSLSKMSLDEFKGWLETVTIAELADEKNVFEYDGTTITSVQAGRPAPRVHTGVSVQLGIIAVPFSVEVATIRIADNLKTATVTYNSQEPVQAKITAKPKG